MPSHRSDVLAGLFDRVCALIGLVVLSPLCLVAACAVLLEDGWPVIYKQQRVGRWGVRFWLYKFRSMRLGQAGTAVTAAGDARLLRVGRVLRRYKIDELPQLWNVVKGDMRLVGPRPEVPTFVDLAMPAWREVLAVPPGLTDLATLVYRNEETVLADREEPERFYRDTILPAKLALSASYLRQRTFWLDLRLIALSTRYAASPASFDGSRIPASAVSRFERGGRAGAPADAPNVDRGETPRWVPPDLWVRARIFLSGPRAQVARTIAHVAVVAAAGALAFLLRFEFDIPQGELVHLWTGLAVWISVKPIVFRLMRIDRSSWSHTSVLDVLTLALANLTGAVLSGLVILAVAAPGFPRSVYVLDLCLCLLGTAALPLTIRLVTELSPRTQRAGVKKRIVIYGAGAAGVAVLREIRRNVRLPYRVCGFVDDEPAMNGVDISQARVLGRGADLKELAWQLGLDEVLIALPSATGPQMTAILQHCQDANLRCKTIPGLTDVIEGRSLATQIRDVAVEDLLGRNPVHLDQTTIEARMSGRVVLVTGAAGSIGSELCRQLARFNPEAIVGYETAETPLFQLQQEFRRRFPTVPFHAEIGSIQNLTRLAEVFDAHRPSAVFHAAAFKHVPIMELHPFEAIENNVFGTLNVAHMAADYGVSDFVMISSDKAVRPTNVMGATKRVAEVGIRSLQHLHERPTFVSVRFGNVLGSNGSVVPIFKDQIAMGGPVTVTHPEMERYFMTIPEASQLVLQASTMGKGGEIFVLDMGAPVRIVDLARKLIFLSGLDSEAVRIEFSGVRPGEKLYEETNGLDEDTLPTSHPKIHVFAGNTIPWVDFDRELARLRRACTRRDLGALVRTLSHLVPEYTPSLDLLARVPAAQTGESGDAVASSGVEAPARHDERDPAEGAAAIRAVTRKLRRAAKAGIRPPRSIATQP